LTSPGSRFCLTERRPNGNVSGSLWAWKRQWKRRRWKICTTLCRFLGDVG
jgi:hypothetical protein